MYKFSEEEIARMEQKLLEAYPEEEIARMEQKLLEAYPDPRDTEDKVDYLEDLGREFGIGLHQYLTAPAGRIIQWASDAARDMRPPNPANSEDWEEKRYSHHAPQGVPGYEFPEVWEEEGSPTQRLGKWIEKKADDRIEELRGEQTQAYKSEQTKNFLSDKEGEFFGEGITSLPKILGFLANAAPSVLTSLTGGGLLTKSLMRAGVKSGVAGTIGFGASEGLISGVNAGKEIEDIIINTPIADLQKNSEDFQGIYKNLSHIRDEQKRLETAREMLARETGQRAAAVVGVGTPLISVPTNIPLGRLMGGQTSKNLLRTTGKHALLEGTEETLQNVSEKVYENYITQKHINPNQDLLEGTGEVGVGGFITGGTMGGAMGGGYHLATRHTRKKMENSQEVDLLGEENPYERASKTIGENADFVSQFLPEPRSELPGAMRMSPVRPETNLLAVPLKKDALLFSQGSSQQTPIQEGLSQAQGLLPLKDLVPQVQESHYEGMAPGILDVVTQRTKTPDMARPFLSPVQTETPATMPQAATLPEPDSIIPTPEVPPAATKPTPPVNIPPNVRVRKTGEPYAPKEAQLVVKNLKRQGIQAEAVQLDEAGKQWGVQELTQPQVAGAFVQDDPVQHILPEKDISQEKEGLEQDFPEEKIKFSIPHKKNVQIPPDRPVSIIEAGTPPPPKHLSKLRIQAVNTAKKHVGKYKNMDTGWEISLSNKGAKHVARDHIEEQNFPAMVAAMQQLPKIIEQAVLVETHADTKNQGFLDQVHRMYAPVRIGDNIYTVKLTVKEAEPGVQEIEEFRLYDLRSEKKMPDGTSVQPESGLSQPASGKSTGKEYPAVPPRAQRAHLQTPWPALDTPLPDSASASSQYPGSEQPTPDNFTITIHDMLKDVKDSTGTPFFKKAGKNTKGMKAKAVQHAVDNLQSQAKHALPLKTVQSETELPTHIRDAAKTQGAEGIIEGVNDGKHVYLVADNISSTRRAVAVWLHEQAIHTGLPRLLGKDYIPTLNRIYIKSGGKSTFQHIAKDYGLDLDIKTDRYRAVEEHLARIAEKVTLDQNLQPKERTMWRSFMDSVLKWLQSLGLNIKLTNMEMGWLVKDAVKHTIHGDTTTQAPQTEPLHQAHAYSKKKEQTTSHTPQTWQEIEETSGKWGEVVDKVVAGRLPSRTILQMGKTPGTLVQLGLPNLPLVMEKSTFDKITGRKSKRGSSHTLTDEQVKELYTEIADPVGVIRIQDRGAYVVLTQMFEGSSPVLVPIHVNVAEGNIRINEMATAYGKDNFNSWLLAQAHNGNVVYLDKTKVAKVKDKSGLQLARVLHAQRQSGNRIRFETDIVKPTGPVQFSRKKQETPLQSAMGKIGVPKETLSQKVQNLRDRFWEKTEQGIFDQFAPLKRLDKEAGATAPEQSAYIATRMTTSLSSNIQAIMEHGAPVWNQGAMDVWAKKKGLVKIFEPVAHELDNFMAWMVGIRANKLMQEGRENLFTQKEIDALLALSKGKEKKWHAVKRDYVSFKNAVLDFAQEAGVIDPEGRKVWSHDEYIPFYRISDDSTVSGPANKKGVASQRSGIKTLKGGTENLGDPFENIIRNFTHLIDASIKNHATELAIGNMEKTGLATPAKMEFIPFKTRADAAATALRKVFEDTQSVWPMNKSQQIRMVNLFQATPPKDADVIHVLRNGKAEYFHVEDPLLLKALTGMSYKPNNNMSMRSARWFKRILTTGVTVTPDFMVRNMIRDTLHTGVAHHKSGYIPGLGAMKGIVKTWKEDADVVSMMAAGASFSGGYNLGHDPAAAKRMTQKYLRKDIDPKSILDTPKKLGEFTVKMWDWWGDVGSKFENATRAEIYAGMKKRGASHLEASFEAKDIMDFSMRGSFPAIRILCETVPFMGARLQGLHKLGRAAHENPKAFITKGAIVAAASALVYLGLNADNPEYDKLSDYEKDLYYHFFTPWGHFRLPKPFEVGFLFGTIPERITEQFVKQPGGKVLAERIWWNLRETFAMGLPQIGAPILEQVSNRDFFRDRPIVPMHLQRLAPGEQADSWTSSTLKEIGRATNISPKRMEHLVNGYFGTLGTYVLSAADMVTSRMFDHPAAPQIQLEDMPLIKSVYRGDRPRRTRYETEMYDLIREVDTLYSTVKAVYEDGRRDEAIAMEKAAEKELRARRWLHKVRRKLSGNRKRQQTIHKSRILTPVEKREKLDKLMEKRNAFIEEQYKKVQEYLKK